MYARKEVLLNNPDEIFGGSGIPKSSVILNSTDYEVLGGADFFEVLAGALDRQLVNTSWEWNDHAPFSRASMNRRKSGRKSVKDGGKTGRKINGADGGESSKHVNFNEFVVSKEGNNVELTTIKGGKYVEPLDDSMKIGPRTGGEYSDEENEENYENLSDIYSAYEDDYPEDEYEDEYDVDTYDEDTAELMDINYGKQDDDEDDDEDEEAMVEIDYPDYSSEDSVDSPDDENADTMEWNDLDVFNLYDDPLDYREQEERDHYRPELDITNFIKYREEEDEERTSHNRDHIEEHEWGNRNTSRTGRPSHNRRGLNSRKPKGSVHREDLHRKGWNGESVNHRKIYSRRAFTTGMGEKDSDACDVYKGGFDSESDQEITHEHERSAYKDIVDKELSEALL